MPHRLHDHAELPETAGTPIDMPAARTSAHRPRCAERTDAPRLFFSGDLDDIAEAQRLCVTCPLIVTCLEGALRRREPWGVWGGQLFHDGAIVRVRRARGRPRKDPAARRELVPLELPRGLSHDAT